MKMDQVLKDDNDHDKGDQNPKGIIMVVTRIEWWGPLKDDKGCDEGYQVP
jgi:hypothetical protein